MKTSKQVTQVYKGSKPNMVGDGFRVQNLFPSGNRIGKAISPFFCSIMPPRYTFRQLISHGALTSTLIGDLKR
ncbi:hypothetical protein MKQ70_30180 [Chitinophaga sedimenti]|uniref:hypothetical protein n=1 Tax=Chitinophaga sedimenti TaxID=2033606 RepID=UPI00200327F3|nr:hypothetical protein [Chitinophaga sedimenti]MCK7559018.1 hypothetical protein [Chitinophaga sedimenti]